MKPPANTTTLGMHDFRRERAFYREPGWLR